MKRYFLFLAAISFALCAFCACDSDDDEELSSSDSISLSADSITADSEGGTYSVTVTSSGTWRISGLCDWATPSAESGSSGATVTFTVEPTGSTESEEATFKFFTGSAVAKLTIYADPAKVLELVSDDSVEVDSDANSITVRLTTNMTDLTYSYSDGGEDWISFTSLNESIGGKYIAAFSIARSQEFTSRESVITITGSNGDAVTVDVTQEQRDTVLCDTPSYVTGLEAETYEMVVRSNVDLTLSNSASWLTLESTETGETEDDGLATTTYTFSLTESTGSRKATITLTGNGSTLGTYTIKQQNPDPTYCYIEDSYLRGYLEYLEWILSEDDEDDPTKAEILSDGMTGTTLSIPYYYRNGSYIYMYCESLSGFGAFPCLESLTIAGNYGYYYTIDVSDCEALTSLTLNRCYRTEEVKLADGITSFTYESNTSSYYGYLYSTSYTISGKNVTTVDFSRSCSYFRYGTYDKCTTLDVTGCPALETLYATRQYDYTSRGTTTTYYAALETIYMTAEQIENVTVTKSDGVEIVEKEAE